MVYDTTLWGQSDTQDLISWKLGFRQFLLEKSNEYFEDDCWYNFICNIEMRLIVSLEVTNVYSGNE